MQTHVYECIRIMLHFILMMVLSRYVFLIPPISKSDSDSIKPQFLFTAGALVGNGLISAFFGLIPALVTLSLTMGIYCFLTGSPGKKRWFRCLLLFPLIGLSYGLLMPLETLPVMVLHLSENAEEIYAIGLYLLLGLGLLIFIIIGRAGKKNFRPEMYYRKLEHWEQVMLYAIGILMLIFIGAVYAYYDIDEQNFRGIAMFESIMMTIIGFAVTLTVIILILVGNKNAYMHKEMLEMQHNIIVMMADIIENRDESTGGHIKRTAKYVQIISETLLENGWYQSVLNQKYINDMVIAAPLHDIGKIHVPDAILKKEGRLTEEEYAIMKSHTTEGRKLLLHAEEALGHFDYLDIAVEMAYGHHEWWNGKGYPQGVSEHNIPLCARIMAVADVFDAIVSQRCYKGSMTIDEAYEIIRSERGTHFDPVIVDAFLDSREKISEALRGFEKPLKNK